MTKPRFACGNPHPPAAVFIGYFQAEMKLSPEGLANLARREWQKLTSPAELLKFVQQARSPLRGKD